MFFLRLLLVFLLIPAALVILAVLTPLEVRLWILVGVFPLALILFAGLRFAADRREAAVDREGGRR